MTWVKSLFSFSNGNCVEVEKDFPDQSWRKSSGCNGGECVEAAGRWRKSSASTHNGNCAEVGQDAAVVGVRDSQDRRGPMLRFSHASWNEFLGRVKADR